MLNRILPQQHAPRWIITGIDCAIAFCALFVAALLRFEFNIPIHEWQVWTHFLPWFFITRGSMFILLKTGAGIIRHTGLADARRIVIANLAGSGVFVLANLVNANWGNGLYLIPFSIIGIELFITTGSMIASRAVVKWLYLYNRRLPGTQIPVAIFGAGEAGLIAKQSIDRALGEQSMRVVAFIDDDRNKVGKKLEGVDIVSASEAELLFRNGRIDRLILSIQHLSRERRRQMVDVALKHGVRPLDVPPVDRWINGELSIGQIRELNIEDLLGREPIKLAPEVAKQSIQGKRICVTGAAGSIGSEIVRQVLEHRPEALLAIDQAETPLHDLHLELVQLGIRERVNLQVGDIRDQEQIRKTLEEFQPHIVFHAAAYKHVPLMEYQPWQAFETNVLGTQRVLDAAIRAQCAKFVMISTDKAVNPTSVMGCTKRLAELLVLNGINTSKTECVITRFGNVLGSNGSVIPLFKQQIERGGPVTVTDSEVTRYFMTIPEAVSLVLEASGLKDQNKVYVFDMGESIRILDLAKKMIALAGLTVDKDIEIAITGLRPGEKMHEELLSSKEELLPTHHPKIMCAQTPESLTAENLQSIGVLAEQKGNHQGTRELLASLIPEYKA
ncbi:MAG: nucleoside-diphosphate sugar epimerase/dehydratase [Bacteroidetes bacterium]|nr:nucleoside-diphosphate sugar epimerase/dehydratase [Bacteroidota bacterium]MDA1335875.1 nucleoside-diphosphate sugar epimerase/dehydratase [Bacteroidota bacterium]